MKKITRILLAFTLILGVTLGFSGRAFADDTYAGDGDYEVSVFHNSSMTTKPMKGKVDEVFERAVVVRNPNGKYKVTFYTNPITYMGFSGEVIKITMMGSNNPIVSSTPPVFTLNDVDMQLDNGTLKADSVSCEMKIMKFIHKNVKVFFKLTKF